MNDVTIGVTRPKEVSERFITAWETGRSQGAYIGFESEEQLLKLLTLNRWKILKVLTGAGELAIREIARRVNCDVKGVHGDLIALINCGLLDRTNSGKVLLPYDEVHIDFTLQAA